MRKHSYKYRGFKNEKVPGNVTHIIIDERVQIVRKNAFKNCWALRSVIMMGDEVTAIEKCAFLSCVSLIFIRLSRRLRIIGPQAFAHCWSLEALFLPPTLEKVGDNAFLNCTPLRILRLPDRLMTMTTTTKMRNSSSCSDDGVEVGRGIIVDCARLLAVSEAQYEFSGVENSDGDDRGKNFNCQPTLESNNEVHDWLHLRHNDRPMHALCHHIGMIGIYSTCENGNEDVDSDDDGRRIISFSNGSKEINDFIIGESEYVHEHEHDEHPNTFGPRHIERSVYLMDEFGMTPLHILTANPHASPDAIVACYHAYPNAVLVMDDSGSSPLDYARKYNVGGLLALIRVLLVGG